MKEPVHEVETIIIGGGISGAAALHRLADAGKDVLLLERGAHLGGVIVSERNEFGALIERGPNSIQSGNEYVEQLIGQLELDDEIVEADNAAANRYVLRDGEMIPVPMNPRSLIETSLLSRRAKLRLLRERFVKPAAPEREESVAEFVRRRLGREPLDYGVNPFVSGIYAGRPEELSLRYAFPTMYELEQQYGSLIRGAIRRAKERRQGAAEHPAPRKRRMFSFREGIAALPQAIEKRWRSRVCTNAEVVGVEFSGGEWGLTTQIEGRERMMRAKRLIVATNAHGAASLLEKLDPTLARALRRVDYPPVAVVSLLYNRAAVQHPLDGFGLLCPEVEKRNVLGIIFSSTIFPNRAPDGSVLLTVFVGGARTPALALLPPKEIEQSVRAELAELLGVSGEPRSCDVAVWKSAIPQYNLGYGEILAAIIDAEARFPGLQLLGNYRGGISVPDCIRSGMKVEV